jgi:hypothetical protein
VIPREVGVPAGEGDGDYMLGTMSISMFHPHESDHSSDPILLYRILVYQVLSGTEIKADDNIQKTIRQRTHHTISNPLA